jgi:hypothetical protein
MSNKMRPEQLQKWAAARPFKAFSIHLSDGTTITDKQPERVIVGFAEVVITTKVGRTPEGRRIAKDWRIIGLHHVVEVSEASARNGHSRRIR